MDYLQSALLLGAIIAVGLEVLKLLGVKTEGKRTTVRIIIATAALGLAYWKLQSDADLSPETLAAYAAGIATAAEGIYRWIVGWASETSQKLLEG